MFSDVEDKYPVSYEQDVSMTVHNEDRDFSVPAKWEGDVQAWILCKIESHKLSVCITTVTQNEACYSKTQVARAKKPLILLSSTLVKNGNIINTPVTAEDIFRRAFDIYRPSCGAVRGKTSRRV